MIRWEIKPENKRIFKIFCSKLVQTAETFSICNNIEVNLMFLSSEKPYLPIPTSKFINSRVKGAHKGPPLQELPVIVQPSDSDGFGRSGFSQDGRTGSLIRPFPAPPLRNLTLDQMEMFHPHVSRVSDYINYVENLLPVFENIFGQYLLVQFRLYIIESVLD